MSGKVGLVSLGCPKALVDSEAILTQLASAGYASWGAAEDADVMIVNTCGFIDLAKDESHAAIAAALDAHDKVIVTGCLGADADALRSRYPSLLAVTGPQAAAAVVNAVRAATPGEAGVEYLMGPAGIKLTPPHYAYLKISEGCNHRCSFCIIPKMRGKLRSRPIGNVLSEAERLVSQGACELLVIAQDTSAYGVDLKYAKDRHRGRSLASNLVTLVAELGKIAEWVRLHYVYPYPNVDDLIPLMVQGLALPYLDIPLQHGSPRLLKAMRRPQSSDKTLQRIEKWRDACPEIVLRSTFIVGFPGETQADFEMLLAFLEAAQLDRVGCFTYSDVKGAAANDFAGAIEESVKLDRQETLLELQAAISARRLQRYLGTSQAVLIDQVDGDRAIARTRGDAPEIDGTVTVRGARRLRPGEFAVVAIDGADEHDLFGRYVGKPLKID